MNRKIKIYSATNENINDLAAIMRSNVELYDRIMPGAFQRYATFFEEYGLPKTYDVEMIEYEGEIVGFLGTIEINNDVVYLLALYFMREHQNKGIGKIVMEHKFHSYKIENRKEIVLLAHQEATWACKFYEKNGFKLISNEEDRIKSYSNKIMENHYIKNSVLYSFKIQ